MLNRLAVCSVVGCLAVLMPAHMNSPAIRQPRTPDPSHSLEASLDVPAEVRQVMARACNNCHSYATEWPWYSKVAPMNWMIESDVRRARAAVNLSEWTTTAGRRRGTAVGTLLAVCEDVKSARMPPAPYRMLHPEARLTPQEVESLCSWTSDATRQVRAGRTNSTTPAAPPPGM